jgi:hypothetical protein
MAFYLTQMPSSFLGKLEGVIFFLMFAFAVLLLHRFLGQEERITAKPTDIEKKGRAS